MLDPDSLSHLADVLELPRDALYLLLLFWHHRRLSALEDKTRDE